MTAAEIMPVVEKMEDEEEGTCWKLREICCCSCEPCQRCWGLFWHWCCCCWPTSDNPTERETNARKEDITYILQQPEGESDTFSENGGERHGSFTSASLSIGSSHSTGGNGQQSTRDLKDLQYDRIEQSRRASGWTMRKESTATTAPLLDLRSLDFWSGFTGQRASTSEGLPVQPKLLLSPGRRDTISSQGSADQIRPDLYETISAEDESYAAGSEGEPCASGPLGAVHFFLSYDISSKSLIVRLIEARDLPKPIQLDSSKTDQAHSNPYIKICLLPNQKDSRQTTLRKKTQNPRYDESFSFEIPFRELQRRTLQLVVKDFDKYSRHRVIGQVLLPCADINVVKGVHFWKQLEAVQAMSQEDLGEILFSLCYLPAAGRLNVDILRAKQLVPTDLVGGAAPYVRVSVVINERHIKTKKTSYKKYTLDPVFNESLSFDVNSVQLQDCTVVVSVLDFNGGVVKDNFIGRVVLGKESSGPHEINHWKNMVQSHRTAIAQWHSLKSRSHCDQQSTASRAVS